MGTISVANLGKAYKQYSTRWSRLKEWVLPRHRPRHTLKWVLQDVNFTVNPGEAVGIMGINGAGKSTLLKMITGTTQPTTGRVLTTGRVAALLELGMGFHPDFTGRQNAFMAGQLLGYSVEEISRLLPGIEAFAEIGDHIDQPVRVYSSGMQVRLAFSVATAIRPDVLIVDEALSVGDAYFQAKCYKRVAEFKAAGTTLLLVSHSPGDVVKHCDRAILLKDGRVSADGPSRDVSNLYLDALFGKKMTSADAGYSSLEATTGLLPEGTADEFNSRPGYNKDEHRWGQGGAAILDYKVVSGTNEYPSRIESGATTDFYFKVRFDSDFESVIPGFLVKTLEGIFLYGTNSFVASEGREHLRVRAGEIQVYKFTLPMSLNEGNYLISFGIASGNPMHDLIPLDRRYDSVLIYVGRHLQFWGITDLKATFESLTADHQD